MYKVEDGANYLRLVNGDNKVWIVPRQDMRTALSIYQPSGVKGRVLKYLLPLTHWIPQVNSLIKASNVSIEMNISLRRLICRVLNIDNFAFSIFEGTPSVHKKVTIQISQDANILAYAKISGSQNIVDLFYHEQSILDKLHKAGVEDIPVCLFCDRIDNVDNEVLFIQSTIKSNTSKITHKWGDVHWDFLTQLHNKTKMALPFRDSDLAKSLFQLETYLHCLSSSDAALLKKCIKQVQNYYGDNEVEFSAYHSDFTPWNMFIESERLFVFDFEYAQLSYPPYFDWFHFFTQTAIFESHLTPKQVAYLFKNEAVNFKELFADILIIYKAYLLDIISRYINRESGNLSGDTMDSICFWINILHHI